MGLFFKHSFLLCINPSLKKTDSLILAERESTVEEKQKEIKHFKKYFVVLFSKLALFLKKRNEKISFEMKKRKLYFVCCSGCMTANYKKTNRRQNINRKRRNKTNGGMNQTDISTKERRKSLKVCHVQAIFIFVIY